MCAGVRETSKTPGRCTRFHDGFERTRARPRTVDEYGPPGGGGGARVHRCNIPNAECTRTQTTLPRHETWPRYNNIRYYHYYYTAAAAAVYGLDIIIVHNIIILGSRPTTPRSGHTSRARTHTLRPHPNSEASYQFVRRSYVAVFPVRVPIQYNII